MHLDGAMTARRLRQPVLKGENDREEDGDAVQHRRPRSLGLGRGRVATTEKDPRLKTGANLKRRDAADGDDGAVALDQFIQFAIDRGHRAFEGRRAGREFRPRAGREALRAFQIALATEPMIMLTGSDRAPDENRPPIADESCVRRARSTKNRSV